MMSQRNFVGRFYLALPFVFYLAATPSALDAQAVQDYRYDQVVSLNPFGILLEFFNAEYERVVSPSATAGFGGSYFSTDTDEYLNADLFYRFYVGQEPLEGWAFGAKAGITNVAGDTFFGLGFDANHSWMLGERENFYVGLGFGLKRLFGASDRDLIPVIPTLRIVNVGIAF